MIPLLISVNPGNIDQNALVITIVGYVTVFLVLAAMVILFIQIHRVQDYFTNRLRKKESGKEIQEKQELQKITGDENAAICTALYLYFTELHDEEKYVMTVRKVSRTYSPWSSKIYGIFNNLKHW
jgi:Na+-transporting methylmalonyl-CoA/oxaloacetate decarboxylase gamma subunit